MTIRRPLSNFICATSSFLCIIMLLFWGRSYLVYEHVGTAVLSGPASIVASFRGQIYLERHSHWIYSGGWQWFGDIANYRYPAIAGADEPSCTWHRFLGFGVGSGTIYYDFAISGSRRTRPYTVTDNFGAVVIPYWAVVALLL